MKVKSSFYAHSTSDSDRESVLGLEKSSLNWGVKFAQNKCQSKIFSANFSE
jgi:hypothetical protein